jgi:rubrerythrin
MANNPDKIILTTRKVDPNYSTIPLMHQTLRIAIYTEMVAYETYMQIIEHFGQAAPFIHITQAQKQHYTMLASLLERYNIDLPINDYTHEIQLPNNLLEACEQGVSAEIQNITMYDNLLLYVQEYPDIKEVFYQLQAASFNHHLPAFRKCTQMIYEQTIHKKEEPSKTQHQLNQFEQTLGELDEVSKQAKAFSKGKFDQESLLKLLNSKHISLIGGALVGALAAVSFTEVLNKKNESKEKGE